MKKIGLMCLLFGMACNSEKKETPAPDLCDAYRTGKFVYRIEGDTMLYRAQREGSTQTENEPGTENIATYNVNWTSNCSYELLLTEKFYADKKSSITIKDGIKATIQLLAATGDSMVFEVSIPGVEKPIRGKMIKTE
jgi:hypothetical protein